MSHPSQSYPSHQTFRSLYSHDDNRSNQHNNRSVVRDRVRKFDMLGKTNGLSSKSSSTQQLITPIDTNINNADKSPTSSMSSYNGSVNSEHIIKSNPIEVKRSESAEKISTNLTTKTILLTKPQISTAKIDIQPTTQQKLTMYHRRTSPPTPPAIQDHSRPKQYEIKPVYTNNNNQLNDNENSISYNMYDDNEIEEPDSFKTFAKPVLVYKDLQLPSSSTQPNGNIQPNKLTKTNFQLKDDTPPRITLNQFKSADIDSVGLEIDDREFHNDFRRAPTIIADYEPNDIQDQHRDVFHSLSHRPPPPVPPSTFSLPNIKEQQQQESQEESNFNRPTRFLPFSNFMTQFGALIVVFIVSMVLVLAIRNDSELRLTSQFVYIYIYAAAIIWMIWCAFDIIKFRRKWMQLTASAMDHEDYMYISESHIDRQFYFPDIHNTGGLFMRVGAGILCMGSLILTVIEITITIATLGSNSETRDALNIKNPPIVSITKAISYILRFLFHCVQFTFLFRYGNLIINRYHLTAKIGLIHLVIANFCTWFEAIVYETIEQMHKKPETTSPIPDIMHSASTDAPISDYNSTVRILVQFVKGMSAAAGGGGHTSGDEASSNKTTLEFLHDIELKLGIYLYPCLIEYSLISVTVFFIMWRNVGNTQKRSFLRFGDRHIFTVNCARASRGLLVGGIIFLLTISTLIPTYVFPDIAPSITHLTELVLLLVSLLTVCASFTHTTKLYYDQHAHVDVFDQALILITTVGDFAYSCFGLFASISNKQSGSQLPNGIEISIGFIAILQTFLQSGFIMDGLKRRVTTKEELRKKPGRETVTALLLMNLAIWMHDSFSAKKVKFNLSQASYYDPSTWAIIQAFTSPLSIFYRFHSSVCLADIWQEVYHGSASHDATRSGGKHATHRLVSINNGYDNQH